MARCYQIDIMYSLLSESCTNIVESVFINVRTHPFMADLPVLAERAFHDTAGKKEGSASPFTGNDRFFSKVNPGRSQTDLPLAAIMCIAGISFFHYLTLY